MDLHLDEAESAALRDILQRALGDTREEIYKTEGADYKVGLKEREAAIQSVLAKLGS